MRTAPASEALPLPAHTCPLCGQPNQCAPAQAGHFDVACWCMNAQFSSQVLNSVPSDMRNKACLCQRCGTGRPSDTHTESGSEN